MQVVQRSEYPETYQMGMRNERHDCTPQTFAGYTTTYIPSCVVNLLDTMTRYRPVRGNEGGNLHSRDPDRPGSYVSEDRLQRRGEILSYSWGACSSFVLWHTVDFK